MTAPNGTFVISVQASNALGTGPESPGMTVSVPIVATLPGAPQNSRGVVRRRYRDTDMDTADEWWRADRLSRRGVTHSGR